MRLLVAKLRGVRGCLLVITLIPLASLAARSQRDPQALAVVAQSFKAMGGTLPNDSRAIGTYARIAGSSKDTGSIRVLTRKTDQTSELLTNTAGSTQVVYSRGYASKKDASGVAVFDLEKALSSNSPVFPLMVVAQAVLDQSSTVEFVGLELVNGVSASHIRICTGSLDQNFSDIVRFATKDVWIASSTNLPVEMSYELYEAQGAPSVAVAVFYSSFQAVNGVKYPFAIQENFDGTPYLSVSITSVAFAVGLTDLDFPLN
jgi:hypothetical protein